ncbi:Leucine-rich repeat domain, L domain-like [Phytophthora cactorum]|nr:Leucine-rich repeat domain, L domain-like [Phytophthora cactorum]
MATSPLVVGDRVDDGSGSLGIVRYVGPVATAKDASALYYGIEWDDWGRGKNDGSVELPSGEQVEHFSGPSGRKLSGHGSPVSYKCSFVKATVFDKTTERSSLLQRLHERYSNEERYSNSEGGAPSDVVVAGEVGTTLGSEKPIEFVGAKKLSTQQTLQTIEKISLSCCQIVELGGQGLGKLAPNLTELDLSRNLFSKWSDVLAITRELPLLETLILSGNRFTVDEESGKDEEAVFENLKLLVLNQTLLSWENVGKIVTRHFPRLERLLLVDNEYEDDQLTAFESTGGWLETLSMLDLSLNRLRSWNQVLQVAGMFVNLSQLFLVGNRIVTLVTDAAKPTAFQKLTTLSLSENLIDSWTSIDALNAFPLLDTLRFSKNPLTTQMSLGEARMLVVARTDHIAVFNASPVREKERKEAEQLYLKRILHELAVIGEDKTEQERVLAAHPRFTRLRELYPEISIDQSGNSGGSGSTTGPRKLASSLIKVSIIPMSMQATSFEPLVKKIPQQMKVSQLKLLIEMKFGVDVPTQVLSFRTDSRVSAFLCLLNVFVCSDADSFWCSTEYAYAARRRQRRSELLRNAEGCTNDAMDGAAGWGKLNTLKWLDINRTEGCTSQAMDAAAEGGFLTVVQWLQHRPESCTSNAFDGATLNNQFEVLLYLCSVRQEQFTAEAVMQQDTDETTDIVSWVIDRHPALWPAFWDE